MLSALKGSCRVLRNHVERELPLALHGGACGGGATVSRASSIWGQTEIPSGEVQLTEVTGCPVGQCRNTLGLVGRQGEGQPSVPRGSGRDPHQRSYQSELSGRIVRKLYLYVSWKAVLLIPASLWLYDVQRFTRHIWGFGHAGIVLFSLLQPADSSLYFCLLLMLYPTSSTSHVCSVPSAVLYLGQGPNSKYFTLFGASWGLEKFLPPWCKSFDDSL